MYELAPEFQGVTTMCAGHRLKDLIGILGSAKGFSAEWQSHTRLVQNRKGRKRRIRNDWIVSSEPIRISEYTAIDDAGFRRPIRRPDSDEVESYVLIASKLGKIELTRIGLKDRCKLVFVFKGVARERLHLRVDYPVQAARRENRILRRSRASVLRACARNKREGRKRHESRAR